MRYAFIMIALITAALISPYKAQADEAGFAAWKAQFKQQAIARGISSTVLQDAVEPAIFKSRVIELDRKQPEGSMTFEEYRRKIVSADRINKGRAMMQKHRALLQQVSEAFDVQPQYIVALWGIETNFGSNTGGFDVIDALATLAYEGRRAEFFTKELYEALNIIQQGHISAHDMTGSWAGAMGQCQFMPSSFNSYAVDFNRDGRKDIWNTLPDVFGSAANYLSKSGWKGDERWGRRVSIQGMISKDLLSLDVSKSLSEWSRLGVRQINGQPLPEVAGMTGSLVAPDGASGPVYLIYNNYRSIMKWNRSTYFATSVGLLADAIALGY